MSDSGRRTATTAATTVHRTNERTNEHNEVRSQFVRSSFLRSFVPSFVPSSVVVRFVTTAAAFVAVACCVCVCDWLLWRSRIHTVGMHHASSPAVSCTALAHLWKTASRTVTASRYRSVAKCGRDWSSRSRSRCACGETHCDALAARRPRPAHKVVTFLERPKAT